MIAATARDRDERAASDRLRMCSDYSNGVGIRSWACGRSGSTTDGGASALRCRMRPVCSRGRGRRCGCAAASARVAAALAAEIDALASENRTVCRPSRSAIRAALTANRTSRRRRSRRWRRRCGSVVRVPVILQDERLSSREAESLLARAREGLAQTQGAARCRVRGGDPAGLPRRAAARHFRRTRKATTP